MIPISRRMKDLLVLSDELVPDSLNRDNMFWVRGIVLELFPQTPDVGVDRSRAHIFSPNPREDLVATDRFSLMLYQEFQDREFVGGQLDPLSIFGNLVSREIDRDLSELDSLRLSPGRPAKDRLHPHHQFVRGKRFADIVVGAELESQDFVAFLSTGAQDDDRGLVSFFLQAPTDVKTAHSREHHVQDDEIDPLFLDELKTQIAVARRLDLIPFHREIVD